MHTENTHEPYVSTEILRLKEVEREFKQRLRQQAILTEIGHYALTSTSLASLMEKTVGLAAQAIDVDMAAVFELSPDQRHFRLAAGIGWKNGSIGSDSISAGPESQIGYTLVSNHPILSGDFVTESRFSVLEILEKNGAEGGISVVIPGKNRPYGVLGLFSKGSRTFSSEDAEFLQGIANILASATLRYNMEAVLRSTQEQLSIVLQGTSNGIIVQDPTGEQIYANEVAARMLGYSSELELMAVPVDEVAVNFEFYDENLQPYSRWNLPGRLAMQGVRDAKVTLLIRQLKSGEERWLHIKAFPLFGTGGEVELVVNILQDITELKRSEQSRRLMSEAGLQLSSLLEQTDVMERVAKLAVEYLSDWCTVHVIDNSHETPLQAVAHKDPSKLKAALDLQQRFPPDWTSPHGLPKVLRTGESEFYPIITPEMLKAMTRGEEHTKIIMELGLRSAMILPLVARGRTIGAITLLWSESNRQYSQADVVLARKLSNLSALAIDNARLYQEAHALNAGLEAQVNKRTSQLQAMITKLRSEIVERRQAQESVIKSERMLNALFESGPDATILIDANGRIVRVNTQAEVMFGYTREEMYTENIDLLVPDRFRSFHQSNRSRFLAQPRTRPMGAGHDLNGRRKDGREFPLDVMLSPVETQDGIQILCAVRDITERRQMEAELAEVQRRLLEHIEAERLHIAQELHDGPIQDLYGVTFALKSIHSGTDLEFNEKMDQAHQLIQHVINQLRATCGDLRPPALAPFGLEKAIRAHLEQVQDANSDLVINSDLMPDGQLLPERVRLALYRIYQHAVSNVLRHSGATQMEVSLGVTEQQVELEISDNGNGFELPARWVQLAREGHLGLVGTVERAEAVGGKLQIQSTPGKGTTIRVLVPVNPETGGYNSQSGLRGWARQPF